MNRPFVTLTLSGSGKKVTVNMNCIAELTVNDDGDTILAEASGQAIWRVNESPAEILMQLEQQNP